MRLCNHRIICKIILTLIMCIIYKNKTHFVYLVNNGV